MLSIGERNISPQLWILYILLAVVVSMLMSCKRLNLHALRNLVASWRCHLPRRALLPFGWVETCGFGVPNFASQPPKATYRRITMKHPHCFVDFPVKYRDAQASHGPPHHLDVDCCKLKTCWRTNFPAARGFEKIAVGTSLMVRFCWPTLPVLCSRIWSNFTSALLP